MATVNYTDLIIERLFAILEGEFKKSIKIYKEDTPDIVHNSISFGEAISENITTWSPDHVKDRVHIDIILRHKWQKDANKKEYINKDLHRIKTAILGNRSNSSGVNWHNGYITDSSEIEIEYNEEGKELFWTRILHFSCSLVYDHTE